MVARLAGTVVIVYSLEECLPWTLSEGFQLPVASKSRPSLSASTQKDASQHEGLIDCPDARFLRLVTPHSHSSSENKHATFSALQRPAVDPPETANIHLFAESLLQPGKRSSFRILLGSEFRMSCSFIPLPHAFSNVPGARHTLGACRSTSCFNSSIETGQVELRTL